MKSALILLALVCLLVAIPMTAAAYEPTNGDALVATLYATKTIVGEEVTALECRGENVTLSSVGMEPPSMNIMLVNLAVAVFDDRKLLTGDGRDFSRLHIRMA